MKTRPVVLGLLAAVAVTGLGFGVANAVAGDDRPLTWTPQSVQDDRRTAKACQANPKDCPTGAPWAGFTKETGFVPLTDPTGATRTPVGYVRESALSDPERRADTEIPVYSDSTGRTQVGTTSGTEGTRVGQ